MFFFIHSFFCITCFSLCWIWNVPGNRFKNMVNEIGVGVTHEVCEITLFRFESERGWHEASILITEHVNHSFTCKKNTHRTVTHSPKCLKIFSISCFIAHSGNKWFSPYQFCCCCCCCQREVYFMNLLAANVRTQFFSFIYEDWAPVVCACFYFHAFLWIHLPK